MKITIKKSDILPEGDYELTDPSKLQNAKANIPFPQSERRILLEYDRIAGRIIRNGSVLPHQSLWNLEKDRKIEQYSDAEIIEVLRRAENTDISGSLYQRARNEWEQRQQEKNIIQVSSLISEIKELKEITKINADKSDNDTKRANWIAKVAIWVSVVGLLLQVALDIERKDFCADYGGKDIRCTRRFELGVFGTWIISDEPETN